MIMLQTKLLYKEEEKPFYSLETKMIVSHSRNYRSKVQQRPGIPFTGKRTNIEEAKKVLSHYCNSYWQENNNSVVASQTSGKHECGLSPYICLWKSLFVLNMSHSSPSVPQHSTWPWPNVVGFLLGAAKIFFFLFCKDTFVLFHTNWFVSVSSAQGILMLLYQTVLIPKRDVLALHTHTCTQKCTQRFYWPPNRDAIAT